MNIIGVDYSLSSPGICISDKQTTDINDCVFHYLTSRKKLTFPSSQFIGTLHKDYLNSEERFDQISSWAINIIIKQKDPIVYLEGYAFGARGRALFQIAENSGLLKFKLYKLGIKFVLVEPTKAKKFFSGKGNASKAYMGDSFFKKTNIDLEKILGTPTENPASDIVDSYALYTYGLSHSNI
jgi:Holliday junction resolvasome RuvABC endonuclease subunit